MNFGQLKTKVTDYLNRNDLTAIIPDFITMAQRKLERRNWKCMEKRATVTLSSGAYQIGRPADFKEARWLQALDTKYYLLEKTSAMNAIAQYPDTVNNIGRPQYWATIEAQTEFLIRPTADKNYTLDLYYYAFLTELINDTDTNFWTDKAWEVLLYAALLEAEPYLVNDTRMATWSTLLNGGILNGKSYKGALELLREQEIREEFAGSPQYVKSNFVV